MSSRCCLCVAIAVFVSDGLIGGGPNTRLLPQQPLLGRFVKTDRGYMVPYQQRIPGTNVSIEFVPVPGGQMTLQRLEPLNVNRRESEESTGDVAESTSSESFTVAFEPFWIGKYEITMAQYLPYRGLYYKQKKAMADGGPRSFDLTEIDVVTGPTDVYEPEYNFEYASAPDAPVPTASQFATRQYTKWLSLITEVEYRLPFRSEWQHACLAGSKGKYSFGNDPRLLERYAVTFDDGPDDSESLHVGTKLPNEWGLFDVHGNVSEFVIEDSATSGLVEGHVACGGNWLSESPDECAFDAIVRTTEDWWDDDPDFPRSSWWMTSEESRASGFRIMSPLEPMTSEMKTVSWDSDSESLSMDVQSRLEGGRGSAGRVSKPKSTTRRVDSGR